MDNNEPQESDVEAQRECNCPLAPDGKPLVSCCKNCRVLSNGFTTDSQDQANSSNNPRNELQDSASAFEASEYQTQPNADLELQNEEVECDYDFSTSQKQQKPTILIIVVNKPNSCQFTNDNGEGGYSNGNNQPQCFQNYPDSSQSSNYIGIGQNPNAGYPDADQNANLQSGNYFNSQTENYQTGVCPNCTYAVQNALGNETGQYSNQFYQNENLPNTSYQAENFQTGPYDEFGANNGSYANPGTFNGQSQQAQGMQLNNETPYLNAGQEDDNDIDIGNLEQTLQALIPNEECLKYLESICKKKKKKKKKPRSVFDRFSEPPFVIEPKQCVNCCCSRPCCACCRCCCNSCYPWH